MHHVKQWLLSGAAVLLIITGIALGLALLVGSPLAGAMLRLALLGAGALVMMWLTLWLLAQPATRHTTGRQAHAGGRQVRLARLHCKLDDPYDPRSFQQFLVQPLLLAGDLRAGGTYQTPLEVIERELLGYVRQLEHTHHGRMAVDIRWKRNSLTIVLTFLTAYEFLAQYHDFVESIRLIRRQIQGLAQNARRWYHQATGRNLAVQADLIMDARTPTTSPARRSQSATYASRFARAMPPAAHSEVRVNIYGFSFPALLNCLVLLFVFLLGTVLAAVVGCSVFGDHDGCMQLTQEIASWLAPFLDPKK
jgi:hypothetical protein